VRTEDSTTKTPRLEDRPGTRESKHKEHKGHEEGILRSGRSQKLLSGEVVTHGLPLTFILSPKGRGEESGDGSGPLLVRMSVETRRQK